QELRESSQEPRARRRQEVPRLRRDDHPRSRRSIEPAGRAHRESNRMTVPQKKQQQLAASSPGDVMESVIIEGDLAALTPEDRVIYYKKVCDSVGLNPLTKPFAYMRPPGGKLQLYARRDCADQLRKLHKVTIELISRDVENDILTVHARARMPDGRTDEDFGAVFFPKTLAGENRANAELRAVTKAKRRVTLSICGLGFPDETEVEDIPGAHAPKPPADNVIQEPSPGPAAPGADAASPSSGHELEGGAAQSLEDQAREAARKSDAAFRDFWRSLDSDDERDRVSAIG